MKPMSELFAVHLISLVPETPSRNLVTLLYQGEQAAAAEAAREAAAEAARVAAAEAAVSAVANKVTHEREDCVFAKDFGSLVLNK